MGKHFVKLVLNFQVFKFKFKVLLNWYVVKIDKLKNFKIPNVAQNWSKPIKTFLDKIITLSNDV